MFSLLYWILLGWIIWRFRQRHYSMVFAAWVVLTPLKQTMVRESYGFQYFDPIIAVAFVTVIAVICAGFSRLRNLSFLHRAILLLHVVFAVWLCLSLLWTPSPAYGGYKAYRFLILNSMLLVAPVILIKKGEDFERMAKLTFVLIVLIYLKIWLSPSYESVGGVENFGRAGFGFGAESATAGVCIAASYCFMKLFQTNRKPVQLFYILAMGFILSGAMMAATRTVIFSILMTPILMLWLLPKRIWKDRFLFPLLLSCSIMIVAVLNTPGLQFQRFADAARGDESIFARYRLWQSAIAAFEKNPIGGLGVGGQSFFDIEQDSRWFCHNIFLETAAELGSGALVILFLELLLVVSCILFNIKRLRRTFSTEDGLLSWLPFSAVAFFTYFCQTLITDDLADNRWLWLCIGFVIAATKTRQLSQSVVTEGREIHSDLRTLALAKDT